MFFPFSENSMANVFENYWRDCKEIVMLVRQGQNAVDEQAKSWMLLLVSGFMGS